MSEKYNFFAYINRMKYINRWGLMRNTESENIQEHSLQVAILSHALALIHNKLFPDSCLDANRACVYGAFHDANEIITGDMPTPIKYYNPAIKENYHTIEDISKNKLLSMIEPDMKDIYSDILFFEKNDGSYYAIVKAADKLSAYIKCAEEVKAGNREFIKAKESTMRAMRDMDNAALNYFIEHYLASFDLSLDELD